MEQVEIGDRVYCKRMERANKLFEKVDKAFEVSKLNQKFKRGSIGVMKKLFKTFKG